MVTSGHAIETAHNPKVTGSNPVPATKESPDHDVNRVRAFDVLDVVRVYRLSSDPVDGDDVDVARLVP